jgi:type II secretory pathway pseudopilin PulG
MNLLPIRPRRRPSEEGYILVAVIFMLALLIIALSVGVPDVRKSIERDREVETLHRGKQFIHAIKLYYKKFGSYPMTVDALVKTNNMRFLRKKYIDPTTGKDEWRPIHMGQTKAPTALGFFGVPMMGSTLGGMANCGVNGLNTSSPGNSSGASPNYGFNNGTSPTSSFGSSTSSFGSSTSSFGSSTSSFGSSTSSFGSSTSGFGSDSSTIGGSSGCPTSDSSGSSNDASGTSGNSNGSSNTPSNPNDPNAASGNANNASANGGNSDNSSGNSNRSNSNPSSGSSDSGSSSAFGGQTFGGGGIIGFAPGSSRQSILVYKKKNHFNQWEFVYDPIVDQMQAMGGGAAPPADTTGLSGSPGMSSTPGLGGTGLGGSGLGGSGLGGSTSSGNSGLGSGSSSDSNSNGTDSGNNPSPPQPPQ